MNKPVLATLHATAEGLSSACEAVEALFRSPAKDGSRFDTALPIPGTEATLDEVLTVARTLVEAATGLSEVKNPFFLPKNNIITLNSSLAAAKLEFDQIVHVNANIGGISMVTNKGSYALQGQNGASTTFNGFLQNAVAHLDSALSSWSIIRSLAQTPRFQDFYEALKSVHLRQAEISKSIEQFEQIRRRLTDLQSQAEEAAKAVVSEKAETERLRTEAEKERRTISEYSSETGQKVELIRSAAQTAATLSSQVSNYAAEFSSFDNQLDARHRKIEESNDLVDELLVELQEEANEVKRLRSEASDMLIGATNAGLAGAFSSRERERSPKKSNLR
ncbi:MAG TPA: hypothetical protein VIL09_19345 [Microvirga sp.]|jgi:hypothetical protein